MHSPYSTNPYATTLGEKIGMAIATGFLVLTLGGLVLCGFLLA